MGLKQEASVKEVRVKYIKLVEGMGGSSFIGHYLQIGQSNYVRVRCPGPTTTVSERHRESGGHQRRLGPVGQGSWDHHSASSWTTLGDEKTESGNRLRMGDWDRVG